MRAILLGMAASLAAAAPAQAQGWSGRGAEAVESSGAVRVHRNADGDHGKWTGGDGEWDRDRGPLRRHRRFQETVVLLGPSHDWDGNRSWDADRWNDWWHERRWRSYPRWVQEAPRADCDRMWWGGGAWRCGW